jgi:glycosyltransferase involved in cell wall biosynthesis
MLSDGRLRQLLGQKGKQYVHHNYTWERVAHKYSRLLAEVVHAPWW